MVANRNILFTVVLINHYFKRIKEDWQIYNQMSRTLVCKIVFLIWHSVPVAYSTTV